MTLDDLGSVGDIFGGSKKNSTGKKAKKRDDDDIIFFGDEEPRKKKKKKKKGEKGGHSSSYGDSLKELSRKELYSKAVMLGVDVSRVDTDSKKALRKAITAKVAGAAPRDPKPLTLEDPKRFHISSPVEGATVVASSAVSGPRNKKGQPYYGFSNDGDFIVRDALQTEDIHVFDAMRALGHARRGLRSDDGFGELIQRIDASLQGKVALDAALDEKREAPQVIDVEYEPVAEESGTNTPA